jgi:hypothetical protein
MLNLIIEFDAAWFKISISCKQIFWSVNSQLKFGGTFVLIRQTFYSDFFKSKIQPHHIDRIIFIYLSRKNGFILIIRLKEDRVWSRKIGKIDVQVRF